MIPGCTQQPQPDVRTLPERPLRKLQSAASRQLWPQAWQYADAVLETHGDDADAIAAVAMVAQQLEKPDQVAELLAKACRVESYQNDDRVRQTMIAMVAAGRLYSAIELLEDATQPHPSRHVTRRWLYDLYINAGNTSAAKPHGQTLIRQRQFDQKLLLSINSDTSETRDAGSTTEMARRNPDDNRPLLRRAKMLLDSGANQDASDLLRQIVDQNPDFAPADALLGQTLAIAADRDAFLQWETKPHNDATRSEAGYWIAKGDAAVSAGSLGDGLRYFWQATQRNPDLPDPWSKIRNLMPKMEISDPEFSTAITERIERLRRVQQTMDRFDRMGGISRQLASEIATDLAGLGRLWEAEAWASMATTLPQDKSVDVEKVRTQIIDRLNDQTPWQITDGHRELQPELPPAVQAKI
ncbi:hypothetical protein K227x_50470 [Rubripirellula lacrimiformis]|uniref:Tetratricopeptide repeat protein n=2 Tax=Rubripirellula lacrimiformis TaxID=1930273 RepID=A0A517NHL8_9BACT|nr:hypothetical protein K227x_50470 [Rubripirellula lacrimiformis]